MAGKQACPGATLLEHTVVVTAFRKSALCTHSLKARSGPGIDWFLLLAFCPSQTEGQKPNAAKGGKRRPFQVTGANAKNVKSIDLNSSVARKKRHIRMPCQPR
jgi:hypothetical protein